MNKIKKSLNSIARLGVKEEMNFQLYKRVILSNQFGVFMVVAATIFSSLFLIRSSYTPIPILGVGFIGVFVLLMNYSGLTSFSRFLVSIAPAIGLMFINVFSKISNPTRIEAYHYTSSRLLIAATILLPLTVFMLNEKKRMFSAIILILSISFFFDNICEMFSVGSEQLGIVSNYKNTALDDVILLVAILLTSSIFITRLNIQYKKINDSLLDEAQAKHDSLNNREVELKQTLEEVEISRREEAKRNWATKGLAELNVMLRSTDDPEKMYRALLKGVVKYLDVNQGGLYICEEKEGKIQIELKSCYAYNRQKFMEKVIMPGEGLIGQSYLEGKPVYLKKIPKEYVSITSGLGKATPKNVLIMPLKMRDKVEGIIEIASFKELEKHEINFLESAGADIASTISTTKVNSKTKKLLDQSRLMSNELMEKEHEMRQNVEELRATQESMARKEQEYLEKIAMLEEELVQIKAHKNT
ncbi:GAF domain-containing protein [Flammeovirgaceae bacterium SG7u.111]|nr:GAF domain-containing protein [Flammeovirgaceae bacterium SG7u.132]WPO36571.1 GAF domain-containing protein [Flammeovirgaceae bacterium SG7u.111]